MIERPDWDLIPKQTHLVEDGRIGDCWRCCIAAILGLPAGDVPHFMSKADGSGYDPMGDTNTQEWLNNRGLWIVRVSGSRSLHFYRRAGGEKPPALISCGPTCRSKEMGQHHSIVTIANDMVYDPHPSHAGLTAIVEQWLVFKPVA